MEDKRPFIVRWVGVWLMTPITPTRSYVPWIQGKCWNTKKKLEQLAKRRGLLIVVAVKDSF